MAFNGSLPDGDDHDFFDPKDAYAFYNRAYAPDYEENQGSLPDGDDHDFFDPENAYAFNNRAYATNCEENDYASDYEENQIHSRSVQLGRATQDECHSACTCPGNYMDWHLLRACSKGDLNLFKHLTQSNHVNAEFSTPHGNNCLHIAAMFGHRRLANEIWSKYPSLVENTNKDGETPLIAALMSANKCLASDMIAAIAKKSDEGINLNRMLLTVDRRGENALNHAIRKGFDDLALLLLNVEPQLSQKKPAMPVAFYPRKPPEKKETPKKTLPEHAENMRRPDYGSMDFDLAYIESAMYMAARRGYPKVVQKLLENQHSEFLAGSKETALHAAVRNGHKGIVKLLLKGRPKLAYKEDAHGNTPLVLAILNNQIELVDIFLRHDPYLGYHISTKASQNTPFIAAALVGAVKIAKTIMEACPDSVYRPDKDGNSALHAAIEKEHLHFVDFVLQECRLYRRLINQATDLGSFPLHLAATISNPKILHSLLPLVGEDCTAVDVFANNAVNKVYAKKGQATLGWIESFALLRSKIPSGWTYLNVVYDKRKKKEEVMKKLKDLSTQYITSTSLVASLLATVTFTAAFTPPGGFSNDLSDDGLPIFIKRAAFQAFLIFDSIAMCSSLAAAFLSILSLWMDVEILLNYTRMTKYLMWCAFQSTSLAFGLALFVVIAPRNMGLSSLILIPCIALPTITYIIGKRPILMLFNRIGRNYSADLMPLI